VSAEIIELRVREGDEVRKDDIIALLDDRELRRVLESASAQKAAEEARIKASQATLEGYRRQMEIAERDLERYRILSESGDATGQQLDTALERVSNLNSSMESTTHSISMSESSLEAAEAEIRRARDAVDNTVITAPMDGTVTLIDVEVGEVVTGSIQQPGTPIMTISDLSRMIMKAEAAESDIASVALGQQAKIYINAYPDETFSGTVRQIALQRTANLDGTGYFETEIELDLQGRRIYSGLIANVDIEIQSHQGIAVPYQAIVARDIDDLPDGVRKSPLIDTTRRKASVIYRLVDGAAVCTPIKAGPSDLTHRVVLEGLSPGERVIVGPFKELESLKDGDLVASADGERGESGGERATEPAGEGSTGERAAEGEPAAARDAS
jgi:HlyD family secretion protein